MAKMGWLKLRIIRGANFANRMAALKFATIIKDLIHSK
jgi:hypothetical protein